MNSQQTIRTAVRALVSLAFLSVAQAANPNPHFWFRRDGSCVGCAQMLPAGTPDTAPQDAGIDVMFNGLFKGNPGVKSYKITYMYRLGGKVHSATSTANGRAAAVTIKPYATVNNNNAEILSITVVATYASGTGTTTARSPEAFKVY